MFKIGDIIRHRLAPEIVGMVVGYGVGRAFASYFNFPSEEQIILVMRENGTVLVIKESNADYEVAGHYDMGEVFKMIVESKEGYL